MITHSAFVPNAVLSPQAEKKQSEQLHIKKDCQEKESNDQSCGEFLKKSFHGTSLVLAPVSLSRAADRAQSLSIRMTTVITILTAIIAIVKIQRITLIFITTLLKRFFLIAALIPCAKHCYTITFDRQNQAHKYLYYSKYASKIRPATGTA